MIDTLSNATLEPTQVGNDPEPDERVWEELALPGASGPAALARKPRSDEPTASSTMEEYLARQQQTEILHPDKIVYVQKRPEAAAFELGAPRSVPACSWL